MSELTLVVLAAGMGKRFGERIKQLEPIGPNGELLIDYSVRDAVKYGFERVVFIIRRDIEELFKSTIGERVEKIVKTEYVYQSVEQLPKREGDFPSRVKPWGTAQALYCCKDVLDGKFAVINADDFYGEESFRLLAEFLKNPDADACSVDFRLANTLSEFGAVNRGVCTIGADGLITSIRETKQIMRIGDGTIQGRFDGYPVTLGGDDVVSMSMWGFNADFMRILAHQLRKFLDNLQPDEGAAELTIAEAVGNEIRSRQYRVRDITTNSKWFGITFESDLNYARKRLANEL